MLHAVITSEGRVSRFLLKDLLKIVMLFQLNHIL